MRIKMEQKKLYKVLSGVDAVGKKETVLKLKDNRWMTMCRNEAEVVMYGAIVAEDSMEEYEKGDIEEIGIDSEGLLSFISKSGGMVDLRMEQTSGGVRRLKIEKPTGSVLETGMINPEYITGMMNKTPDLDWTTEFTADVSFLEDFIKTCNNIVGSGSFTISPRDDSLYLYSEYDDSSTYETHNWQDFESVESTDSSNTILSAEHASTLDFMDDVAKIYLGDHIPTKFVLDLGEGIRTSYIMSPRIDEKGDGTPPDRIFEQ